MKVTISSDPKLLNILRVVVRYFAHRAGFSPADADCMTMAIDEACSNVIRHAYGNRSTEKLSLEIVSSSDRMEFILEDSGPKVREDEIRPRALEDVRPGGLGTLFIQKFMDQCCYDEAFQKGNRLKLVKFIRPQAPSGHEGCDS